MNIMLKKICCLMLAALMVITSQTFAVYAEEYDEEVVEEYIEDIETDIEEEEQEQKETEPTVSQDNAPVYFADNMIAGELFLNPADVNEQSSFEYILMVNCGFFEKGASPQNKVTRGDMCKILYAMLIGDFNYTYSGIPLFSDVGTGHKLMPYVEALGDMGIIGGNGTGMFYPDRSITVEETVKMLVNALGYVTVAESKGGYPIGYMRVANDCRIMDGIDNYGDGVTYNMLAKMLCNMLDVVPAGNPYIGDVQYYNYAKTQPGTNPTTFSDMVNLYSDYGVVEGDDTNTTGTLAHKDCLRINGENYKTDGGDYTDIIGVNVSYFYSVDHTNDTKDMLMLVPHSSDFEILSLEADRVVDASAARITYELEQSGRQKHIDISGAVVFYNGKLAYGLDVSQKIRELTQKTCGHVRILTDKTDIAVHIWDYDVYQVIAVDKNANIIYANNLDGVETKIELDNYDKYQILRSGTSINPDLIKKNWVIMTATSLNHEFIRLECFNDKYTVVGTIEGIASEDTVYYTIGGITLKADPRFLMKNEHKMKLNVGVKFYLDKYGRIVFHQFTENDGYQYGYLIDAMETPGLDKTVLLRVLSESGEIKEYTVSDKVKITYPANVYATNTYEYTLKSESNIMRLSGLVGDDGQVIPQLVKYQLNQEGYVNVLKLAKNDFLFETVPVRDYDNMGNVLSDPSQAEDVFIADYDVESVPVGNSIHVTDRNYGRYPFGVTANGERNYNQDDFVRCYTNFDVAKYVEGDDTFSFYKFHEDRGVVKYTGATDSGDFGDSYNNLPGYMVRLVSSDSVTGIIYSLDSRYIITNDTKVFVVPAKADENGFIALDGDAPEEAYTIGDMMSWQSKRYEQVQLFDVDENNFVKAMILIDRNSLPMSLKSTNATGVLPTNCVVGESPVNVLVNGERFVKVSVYEKGIFKDLIMPIDADYTDDGMAMRHFDINGAFAGLYGFKYSFDGTDKEAVFENDIRGLYQGTAFSKLQKGDVIKYSLDADGYVKNFTVAFSYDEASKYGYYEDSLASVNTFGNLTATVNSNLGSAVSLKNGSMTYVSSAEIYVYGKAAGQKELTASYNSITMDTRLLSLALYPRFAASANVKRQYVVYKDNYSTIASIPVKRTLTVSDSVYCYLFDRERETVTKILFTDILPEDEIFWAQADSKSSGLLLVIR